MSESAFSAIQMQGLVKVPLALVAHWEEELKGEEGEDSEQQPLDFLLFNSENSNFFDS